MKSLNIQDPTAIVRLSAPKNPSEALFKFFDGADHGVEIRPVARFKFGVKELSMGANFECAAARRDERERLDPLAQFENFGRQTDGLRGVVSNHAIFDRDLGLHGKLLSEVDVIGTSKPGQDAALTRRRRPTSQPAGLEARRRLT